VRKKGRNIKIEFVLLVLMKLDPPTKNRFWPWPKGSVGPHQKKKTAARCVQQNIKGHPSIKEKMHYSTCLEDFFLACGSSICHF